MATKEELLEQAKDLDIKGRTGLNKEELEEAIAEAEAAKSNEPGFESDASDLDDPEVVANLSETGQEAVEEMTETQKDFADAALDASGPLHLQSPSERIQTGALSEEQGKEQRKNSEISKKNPHSGNILETGEVPKPEQRGSLKDNLGPGDDREIYEVRPEDVINFPPPLAVGDELAHGYSQPGEIYPQKSVLYTDGLGREANQNLERAYEIPELLQSNNPKQRESGDESVSEAAEEDKSDHDKKLTKLVTERDDDPSSREALNRPE